jgi:hypothetical protein
MNARLWTPLLLLLIAQPEQQHFRYERNIKDLPAQQKQTCVALDVTTFARASAGLADLRLYRDGQETPYALRVDEPVSTALANIAPLNLGQSNGKVVFDAEMPSGSYSTLQLDLQGKEFIASVDVSGSKTQDAGGETQLGTYTVFDLTGQKLGRSMTLHLPISDLRYLHFRIEGPVEPEDVTGLSIEREPLQPAQYLTVAASKAVLRQGRESVAEFTVSANVPVERIEFVPVASSLNFNRSVSIQIAEIRNGRSLPDVRNYDGEIRRVHGVHSGRRIDDEQLTIDVGSTTMPATTGWTVKIHNGDDLPLPLSTVRLQMRKRSLCFDAIPGTDYTLYYGDPVLSAPQYDYASLFQPDKDAAQATLGPEQINPQFKPRPDERPFTERHPALLWIALVIVVLALGGIALRSARRVVPKS